MSFNRETCDPASLLPSLSRPELERVIRERLAEGDRELGELVFSLCEEKQDKRSPAAIVDKVMREYQNDTGDGYIADGYGFGVELRRLCDRGMSAFADGNSGFAVQLLMGLVERAAPHALDGSYDEDCPILEVVEDALARLLALAKSSDADPAALRQLGTWSLQNIDAHWTREGESWDLRCLEIAAAAARDPAEMRAVLEICPRFTESQRTKWRLAHDVGPVSLIALDLLTRIGDGPARHAYVEAHLGLKEIRGVAVDEAMSVGEFDRAIELCREGERIFRERDEDGVADEFAERLVKALDGAGKKEEAARELEKLVGLSFSRNRFDALKIRCSPRTSWIDVRARVIATLEKRGSSHALAAIYESEGMLERLLVIAEKNSFIFEESIESIGRAFPEQAARFIKNKVETELRRTAGRGFYADNAVAILKYGTYAGKKAAEELFDSLLARYPARSAMRDEFQKARGKYGCASSKRA